MRLCLLPQSVAARLLLQASDVAARRRRTNLEIERKPGCVPVLRCSRGGDPGRRARWDRANAQSRQDEVSQARTNGNRMCGALLAFRSHRARSYRRVSRRAASRLTLAAPTRSSLSGSEHCTLHGKLSRRVAPGGQCPQTHSFRSPSAPDCWSANQFRSTVPPPVSPVCNDTSHPRG